MKIKYIIVFVLIAACLIGRLIWNNKDYQKNELIVPFIRVVNEVVRFSGGSNNLKQTVTKALEGTEGNYAIVVKNLKTGESYYKDEGKKYSIGSLYKLWVMAEAERQIAGGQLSETEILSDDVAAVNNRYGIPPEAADLSEGVISFTVKEAIEQMITISHNYAAWLLAEKLGANNVREFLRMNNFKESVYSDPPQSTAADIALFLEKLYNSEFVGSPQMIEILKKQQLNSKLPKYLPEGTIIAHKTGEVDYFSHDAGIVYTDRGDYIIVVFSESDYPPGAEDRIAQISKAVYEYFTEKN